MYVSFVCVIYKCCCRYVLLKDTGELQRHIDKADSTPKNMFGMDGSRKKKRKGGNVGRSVGAPQGTGGLGASNAPRGPSHSGSGQGGAQTRDAQVGPNTAVYVSKLPQAVTWTVLDMMFSAYGRVKRIKIYRDKSGVPKGDALIT